MNDQAIPAHWSEKPAEERLVLAVLNLVLEMVLADSRLTVEELDTALGMVNFYLPPPGLTVEDFGEMVADAAARPPDRGGGGAQGMSSYTCKLRTILSYLRVSISPK